MFCSIRVVGLQFLTVTDIRSNYIFIFYLLLFVYQELLFRKKLNPECTPIYSEKPSLSNKNALRVRVKPLHLNSSMINREDVVYGTKSGIKCSHRRNHQVLVVPWTI